jgi:hypothetical protein
MNKQKKVAENKLISGIPDFRISFRISGILSVFPDFFPEFLINTKTEII